MIDLIFTLIPRPYRDILNAPCAVTNWYDYQSKEIIFGQACIPARKFNFALQRVMLVAAEAFAVYALWGQVPPVLMISVSVLTAAVLSVPATIISAGSLLTFYGVTKIVQAIAIKSMPHAGIGLAAYAVSWAILSCHDLKEIRRGILEKPIKIISLRYENNIVYLFFKMCCFSYKKH